jgi:uncharacterized protein (TIGR03437 family)
MFIRALFFYSALVLAASAATFPVLTYSTYLRDSFTPKAIAADSSGNIYITGYAIVDPAAAQTTVLVVKLNPQASEYLYVRYLGGSVGDYANAIAVDGAGNVYIAGSTASPDFPVTSGGNLGTAPMGLASQRSFVAKLDPNGNVVFSDLLGGSSSSAAQAVAVNAAGQILVSGSCGLGAGSCSSGFPSTAGAYSIPNSANHPYLLELDPTGTKNVFSATGIGGSAIALDSSGNIYVAGTTYLLDYPTTPGAYQTTFPAFYTCLFLCQLSSQGANQYVTKVNAAGSKLIYSTSVSGSYNTVNTGLAVDAAGNAYLTGFAGATYPYTVPPPVIPSGGAIATAYDALPFLSKLDPLGQTLLFSVPVGGAGVQVDSKGAVYAGGEIGSEVLEDFAIMATIPALASVPTQCLPNSVTIQNSAYVSQVDAASGSLLGTQFLGGSSLTAAAVALTGSTLWIAGSTTLADIPLTPDALTVEFLASIPLQGPYPGAGPVAGAYLGAVDFSQPAPPAGTPQIGCIVNAANLAPIGPATRYQLLTIFGTGLGPATGVRANNNSTFSLAGVSVNFGAFSAPLLYASSTQINLAVPLITYSQSSSLVQVMVNGVFSPPLQLSLTYQNPSLFLNIPQTFAASLNPQGPVALALNADGSTNSPTNPALLGSVISLFVNGLAQDPDVNYGPLQLSAAPGWQVTNIVQVSPFVIQVDVQLPATVTGVAEVGGGGIDLMLNFGGQTFGGTVYVTNSQ